MRQHILLGGQTETTRATHSTHKARPAPLPPERLHRTVPLADALLAPLALRHAQPHVARLAVRVPAVHGEAHVVVRKGPVAAHRQVLFPVSLGWRRRREERVAALCAEEMLLVIRPLPERGVVQCDEPLVDDRRLAGVAPRREVLYVPGMSAHVHG